MYFVLKITVLRDFDVERGGGLFLIAPLLNWNENRYLLIFKGQGNYKKKIQVHSEIFPYQEL